MNYAETLDYLYTKLPMFSRIGSAAFKKDLTNIRILCEKSGNPHTKFKSIHIAGTNGKGSVSHMLAAILQTAGYKTGLYTSPHLYDFRERIKINGEMVSEEFVIHFVAKTGSLIKEIQPSFFEITVAMAFEYFAQQGVEVAVVEVGLGGRLDSTNIISPILSVITNIGWDHMNMLGNSLEEIAFEKAGIIKEKIPVVIGETLPQTKKIFQETSLKQNAPVYFAEKDLKVTAYELSPKNIKVEVEGMGKESFKIDLPGVYQTKNLLTVLKSVEVLNDSGFQIENETIKTGLSNTKKLTGLHGRWEVLQSNPTVVLEVAHNKDGIRQMLNHIEQLNFEQLHIVYGTVKDKDVNTILELLPTTAHYYFTEANIPRALNKEELKQKAGKYHLQGEAFINANEALKVAKENAQANDLIIVCGSIFLVAEVNKNIFANPHKDNTRESGLS